MKLNADELEIVAKRMDTYQIIYQEIHDELTDHMISAIETARANGDQRTVELVFDDVVNNNFSGDQAFKKIQLKYVRAYNKQIMKIMRANIKYYLNWQVILLIVAMVIASFYLPQTKVIPTVLLFTLIIAAFWPCFYALLKSKNIKTKKKKMSLIKSYVTSVSQFLTFIVYITLFVFRFIANKLHITFLNPAHYPPVVYVLLLSFFIIYALSSIRLCRRLLKLDL